MSLRKAREVAMQFLYGYEMTGDKEENPEREEGAPEDDSGEPRRKLNREQMDYVAAVRDLVPDQLKAIDETIDANLFNWTVSRLSKVDLAILRLAIMELDYLDLGTPPKVVINEMAEIAKKYSDDKSARFINGVLAGYLEHKGVEGFHVDRTDQVRREQREEEQRKREAEGKLKAQAKTTEDNNEETAIQPLNLSLAEERKTRHVRGTKTPAHRQTTHKRNGGPQSGRSRASADRARSGPGKGRVPRVSSARTGLRARKTAVQSARAGKSTNKMEN